MGYLCDAETLMLASPNRDDEVRDTTNAGGEVNRKNGFTNFILFVTDPDVSESVPLQQTHCPFLYSYISNPPSQPLVTE